MLRRCLTRVLRATPNRIPQMKDARSFARLCALRHGRCYRWCPPLQRGLPARSRRVWMPTNPCSRSSTCTALAWSKPCSSNIQPPGSRCAAAPATMSRKASKPSPPGVSASAGSWPRAARCGVAGRNVGRIAQYEVKPALRHGLPPRTADEFDVQCQAACIGPGDAQRGRAHVGRGHGGDGLRVFHGQGDRTTAGAEIDDVSARRAGQQFERPVDQHLGFGAGNQDVRIHLQHQAVELLLAEQVGERLARSAPGEPCPQAAGLFGVHLGVIVR